MYGIILDRNEPTSEDSICHRSIEDCNELLLSGEGETPSQWNWLKIVLSGGVSY